MPLESRKKRNLRKPGGGDDSDDDYENVRDAEVMAALTTDTSLLLTDILFQAL